MISTAKRPRASRALKCELASEVLRSSGGLRLRVTGWSMLPTIWPGDTLLIDPVRRDNVVEGDVVLFARNHRLVAHRVVSRPEVSKGCLPGNRKVQTQGDAVSQPDGPVSDGELMGRVSAIFRNEKRIEPRRSLRPSERAAAAVLRRSETAARVVAGMLTMRQTPQDRISPCQP